MNNDNKMSLEKTHNDIQMLYDSKTFFVWRNDMGKIVCMASYSITDGQAKVSHVYTPLEERKKGYASNLIYNITNVLLAKNLTPCLYTDYNYLPSNKAYMNVGYKDNGVLINFSCTMKKEKRNI